MEINTYVVKTVEFGQYDFADFRPFSLSVFYDYGGTAAEDLSNFIVSYGANRVALTELSLVLRHFNTVS